MFDFLYLILRRFLKFFLAKSVLPVHLNYLIYQSKYFTFEYLLKGRIVSISMPGSAIGKEGWFKQECVEEFAIPKNKASEANILGQNSAATDSVVVKRKTLLDLIAHADFSNVPRTVVLQRGKKGFGFVLRGAKSIFFYLLYVLNRFLIPFL